MEYDSLETTNSLIKAKRAQAMTNAKKQNTPMCHMRLMEFCCNSFTYWFKCRSCDRVVTEGGGRIEQD